MFTGKVAVVTGAAVGGIGAAIARALAEEGARIVVADINEEGGQATARELVQQGHEAIFLPLDIGSVESARAMADQAAQRFGRIDYLANNAALFGGMPSGTLMKIDWGDLRRLIDVNLLGGLNVARAVVPHMEKQGGGAIVATSSSAAWMGGGHYSLAKLGVNSITASLAAELGPRNIRVNAIAPGPTETPAMHRQTPEEYKGMILAQLPIGRFADPSEQANAVVFLLSDKASFITGSVMSVDGGHIFRA